MAVALPGMLPCHAPLFNRHHCPATSSPPRLPHRHCPTTPPGHAGITPRPGLPYRRLACRRFARQLQVTAGNAQNSRQLVWYARGHRTLPSFGLNFPPPPSSVSTGAFTAFEFTPCSMSSEYTASSYHHATELLSPLVERNVVCRPSTETENRSSSFAANVSPSSLAVGVFVTAPTPTLFAH